MNPNRIIRLEGKSLKVTDIPLKMLPQIRKMGGVYRKRKGEWSFVLKLDTLEILFGLGYRPDENLRRWWSENLDFDYDASLFDRKLDSVLRNYQKVGVNFLLRRKGNALLADEMGLGKTLQVLSYLHLRRESLPALVVCPSSVKRKWAAEVRKWTDLSWCIVEGMFSPEKQGSCSWPERDVYIVNYDIIYITEENPKNPKEMMVLPRPDLPCPETVVFDECHFLGNRKSKRTIAARQLSSKASGTIGMSGTPIENRPMDAWNICMMINPAVMPSFWNFAQRYCGAKRTRWGWDFGGSSNTREFHDLLSDTMMLRRKKKDVLKDLPEKMISVIPVDWDVDLYEKKKRAILEAYRESTGSDKGMVAVEALKHAASLAKMKHAATWMHEFLSGDEKLVVFTRRRDTIETLCKLMKEHNPVMVDGRVAGKERQKRIDRFQNDEKYRIFLGNMEACGTGIELTASSTVAFTELGWTPSLHDQCGDRTHRIGQKKNVNIYYLIAEGTIEDRILGLLDRKRKVVSSIMDGKNVRDFDLLAELLKQIK